jgi:hypothetical protein
MKKYASDSRPSILGLALAAALTFGTLASAQEAAVSDPASAAAAAPLSEAQVRTQLNGMGYVTIKNLVLVEGTWTASVAKVDGIESKVHIDAKSGNSYTDGAPRRLGVTEVESALASAGYTKVRDLKMDGDFWQAMAEDASGKTMALRIDPTTGKVFAADTTTSN